MKKDLNINYININKDSKYKKIDLIEVDISKGEINFIQKERPKIQLIPLRQQISKKDERKNEKRLKFSPGGAGYTSPSTPTPEPTPTPTPTPEPTPETFDSDALAYINSVEAADDQSLEEPVKILIDNFVKGCKTDGIWTSIESCCIMAGARTLGGALTPLRGPDPINNGFTRFHYDRKKGLKGDGEGRYLSSNYYADNTLKNDHSLGVYIGEAFTTQNGKVLIGCGATGPGASQILVSNSQIQSRNRSGEPKSVPIGAQNGFYGTNRDNTETYNYNYFGNIGWFDNRSTDPSDQVINVFARALSAPNYSPDRLSFYWIGRSIDLDKLNSRISTFMSSLDSILP
jgi:hypothetical protein